MNFDDLLITTPLMNPNKPEGSEKENKSSSEQKPHNYGFVSDYEALFDKKNSEITSEKMIASCTGNVVYIV